ENASPAFSSLEGGGTHSPTQTVHRQDQAVRRAYQHRGFAVQGKDQRRTAYGRFGMAGIAVGEADILPVLQQERPALERGSAMVDGEHGVGGGKKDVGMGVSVEIGQGRSAAVVAAVVDDSRNLPDSVLGLEKGVEK